MGSSPVSATLGDQLRRERLLDMEGRLAHVRRRAFGVLALALLAGSPWIGAWFLVPLAAAGAAFLLSDRMLRRSGHPERWAAFGWGVAPLAIASSVMLTGASTSPALAWFALPVVTLGARFEPRGVRFGVAWTVFLLLLVTAVADHEAVLANPSYLIGCFALVISIGILAGASAASEREHRRGAVVDPLTGLLNRSALAQRFAELELQAGQHTEASLGLLLADVDHFKEVNDQHGHLVGDAVLTDVAYAMRKALRAFDLIYRVGGEEFVVLLPGADLEKTREIGERLRAAVAEGPTGGVRVTLSIGAVSARGAGVEYATLFREADSALYRAKGAGRDRVEVAGWRPVDPAVSLSASPVAAGPAGAVVAI
jgi:diguanylate cyclase (GGDEF)-like protein